MLGVSNKISLLNFSLTQLIISLRVVLVRCNAAIYNRYKHKAMWSSTACALRRYWQKEWNVSESGLATQGVSWV